MHRNRAIYDADWRLQVANQSRFGIEPPVVTPEASFPPSRRPPRSGVNDDVHRPLHSSKIALNAPSCLSLTIHYANSLEEDAAPWKEKEKEEKEKRKDWVISEQLIDLEIHSRRCTDSGVNYHPGGEKTTRLDLHRAISDRR